MAENLEQKRSLDGRCLRMAELMRDRQSELSVEAADAQSKLQLLIASTIQLQRQASDLFLSTPLKSSAR